MSRLAAAAANIYPQHEVTSKFFDTQESDEGASKLSVLDLVG